MLVSSLSFSTQYLGNKKMKHWALLPTCALFCATAYASPMTYGTAKVLANRHEKSLSTTQLQVLTTAQGTVGGKAIAECLATGHAAKPTSFALVMELDAAGTVVHTWREGDSEISKCFESKMAAQKLFTPPFSPFYTVFEINLN